MLRVGIVCVFFLVSVAANARAVELLYVLDPPPSSELFGASVLGLGDLDGDGREDFAVGDFDADVPESRMGRVSLYHGAALAPTAPYLNLLGDVRLRALGWRMVRVGDFDGDGTEDLAVTALNGTSYPSTGATDGRVEIHFDLPNLDTVPDVVLTGPLGQWMGQSMAGGQDVNGDGRDDLIVGTLNASPGEGRAFLFLGGSAPAAVPSLTLNAAGYTSTSSVAMIGDLNLDGFADFAVSQHGEEGATDNEGEVQIFHGGAVPDFLPELTIHGATGERLGRRLASADFDGDGHLDLLAQGGDPSSHVHVYRGGPAFDDLPDLTLTGGREFAVLGDVSGDGVDDVGIVTTRTIRIYYGGTPMDAIPDAILDSRHHDAVLAGADVDGDGQNELLVGLLHQDRAMVFDELFSDCNDNDQPDHVDAQLGLLEDCDGNQLGDTCDIQFDPSLDCNDNGVIDSCEIAQDPSIDCDNSGVIDTCEQDCNDNGLHDSCDIAADPALDCNGDGRIDTCEVVESPSRDCDANGLVDSCEIAAAPGLDCNANGKLDSCDIDAAPQIDCDSNGAIDDCEIASTPGLDCDNSLTLDACDVVGDPGLDCNANGWFDACERLAIPSVDCDGNHVIDVCDIALGNHPDGDGDGLPDLCDTPVRIGGYFDANLTVDNFTPLTTPVQVSITIAMELGGSFSSTPVSRVEFAVDMPAGVMPYGRTLLVPGLDIAPEPDQWVINLAPHAAAVDGRLPLVRYDAWILAPLINGKIPVLDATSATATSQVVRPYWREAAGSGHLIPDARAAWINRTFGDCNFNAVDDAFEIAMGAEADTNGDGIPDSCQGITATPDTPEYRLGLAQNWPNPFNPATTIAFSLEREGSAELTIFDAAGRVVVRLASGTFGAGLHQMTWRGKDSQGLAVATGVYFYRLEAGGRVITRKMALLR